MSMTSYSAGDLRGAADIAVIEADASEALRERLRDGAPAAMVDAEALDEEDGIALAIVAVEEVDAVGVNRTASSTCRCVFG